MSRAHWLNLVILSYLVGRNWEDRGSRPIPARSSPGPISTNDWWWWHVPVVPAVHGSPNKRIVVQSSPGINVRPCLKNNQNNNKKSWRRAPVIEHLPSKHKVLSLKTMVLQKKDF
jgi:hypothetical protein